MKFQLFFVLALILSRPAFAQLDDFETPARDGFDAYYSLEQLDQIQNELTKRVRNALIGQEQLPADQKAKLILNAAKSTPGVFSASLSAQNDVGVVFKDGTPFIFAAQTRAEGKNDEPNPYKGSFNSNWNETVSAPPFQQLGGTYELADSTDVVLIDVDGLGSTNTAILPGMFKAKNFRLQSSKGTINELKNKVKNAGVVWFASHSAEPDIEVNGKTYSFFAVETADYGTLEENCKTPETRKDCLANREDEKEFRLIRISPDQGKSIRWFLTGRFIKKYWTFSKKSLAILDICSTMEKSTSAQLFRNSFRAVQAHTLVGWDRVVTALGAVPVIKRFVDKVLGTNQYQAVKPLHRPFSVNEVYQYLIEQGYDQETYGPAKFTIDAPAGKQLILVPSIKWMDVDEKKETLTLSGEFGELEQKVKIDDTDTKVKSWKHNEVVIELPRTGKGSFGPVKILADQRASNIAPLTQWNGMVDMKMTVKMYGGTPGMWTHTHCPKIRVRGDLHQYRDLPGRTPVSGRLGMNRLYFPEAAKDLFCTWEVGGEAVSDAAKFVYPAKNGTIKWSPNMPEDEGLNPMKDQYMIFVGNIDMKTKKFTIFPADNYQFKMETWVDMGGGNWQKISETPAAPMFNSNGMTQNWSALYPHAMDANFSVPKKTMNIPDLQNMANDRTFEVEMKAESIPDDSTEG